MKSQLSPADGCSDGYVSALGELLGIAQGHIGAGQEANWLPPDYQMASPAH